jgi:hypothetical protein
VLVVVTDVVCVCVCVCVFILEQGTVFTILRKAVAETSITLVVSIRQCARMEDGYSHYTHFCEISH